MSPEQTRMSILQTRSSLMTSSPTNENIPHWPMTTQAMMNWTFKYSACQPRATQQKYTNKSIYIQTSHTASIKGEQNSVHGLATCSADLLLLTQV